MLTAISDQNRRRWAHVSSVRPAANSHLRLIKPGSGYRTIDGLLVVVSFWLHLVESIYPEGCVRVQTVQAGWIKTDTVFFFSSVIRRFLAGDDAQTRVTLRKIHVTEQGKMYPFKKIVHTPFSHPTTSVKPVSDFSLNAPRILSRRRPSEWCHVGGNVTRRGCSLTVEVFPSALIQDPPRHPAEVLVQPQYFHFVSLHVSLIICTSEIIVLNPLISVM